MITITIANDQEEVDVQVNGKQRIYDTMRILNKAGLFSKHAYFECCIWRNHNIITPYMNFHQAEILNGDKLILIE